MSSFSGLPITLPCLQHQWVWQKEKKEQYSFPFSLKRKSLKSNTRERAMPTSTLHYPKTKCHSLSPTKHVKCIAVNIKIALFHPLFSLTLTPVQPQKSTTEITINWKILKEMRIPDHLTCLLRNLHAGQEAVRTGHGTTDWFQIGKGVRQGCILSPCLFNLYAEWKVKWKWSHSIMSDSLRPHGL